MNFKHKMHIPIFQQYAEPKIFPDLIYKDQSQDEWNKMINQLYQDVRHNQSRISEEICSLYNQSNKFMSNSSSKRSFILQGKHEISIQSQKSQSSNEIQRWELKKQQSDSSWEQTEKKIVNAEIGCNCKKSKCLKLYCQCFRSQNYCTQLCNCGQCGNILQNLEEHHRAIIEVLSRNPKGFDEQKNNGKETFSLGYENHLIRKGCKCKKTKCCKKYCQCFSGGLRCNQFCKCSNCQNYF